ncbi:cytochrome [Sesamum alatum]|uniref:Cytochrome n=1 Tax=Sesamum alatum TaxID=300844 RepID=A0AAE1YEH1_9LAMI|nr:cytochrome [Sesamum alatum]
MGDKKKQNKGKYMTCRICKRTNHLEKDCYFRGKPQCRNCKRFGRVEKDCRLKGNHQANCIEENPSSDQLFFTCNSVVEAGDATWYIDSAASNHMAYNKGAFKKLDESYKKNVKFGDNHIESSTRPPSKAALLGHLYLLKKPLYRSLANISDRYGPVVLLKFGSRRVLVVSSPSAAEECFTINDVIFANRPRLLAGKYLGSNYTSLAWTSYSDHWRNLRKISSMILSTQRLQMLHWIREDEVKSTIRALNRASEQRRVVDMKLVFFELTMNVVMRMIAGKRYYGENVAEVEEAQRFREIVKHSFRLSTSNMGDFLPVIRWLGVGGVEKGLVELQRKRNAFMQELVEGCKRRFKSYGGDVVAEVKSKTMIEMLLALQAKEPEYYTDALIRNLMLVSFLFLTFESNSNYVGLF